MSQHDGLYLIDRYLNGTADPVELTELDRRLTREPELAEAFAQVGRFDGLLGVYLRRRRDAGAVDAARQRVGFAGAEDAATVAGRTAAVAKASLDTALPRPRFAGGPRSAGRLAAAGAALAALLALAAGVVMLVRTDRVGAVGHTVLAGQVVSNGATATHLVDGVDVTVVGESAAVIRLADGSQAELSPTSEAVFGRAEGDGVTVELNWGRGRFRVEAGSKFRVRTPMGTVTALGTEFTVELRPQDPQGVEDMQRNGVKALVVAVAAGSVMVDFAGHSQKLGLGESKAFAQDKQPSPAALPSGDLFFTGKNDSPLALENLFPGVVGALMLTDEQKQKLFDALAATVGREDIRNAGRNIKTDPNTTEEQRQAYRKMIREARTQLSEKVAAILTAEQKALVPRLQAAADEASRVAKEALAGEAPAKGADKAELAAFAAKVREKSGEEFARKLNGILTPDQFAAYQKAAEAQKAAGGKGGKGADKGAGSGGIKQ
jgi:hypothetical protein